MNIEEIMTEVKIVMESYNLTFEQALELFKVQKTLENLCERIDKISTEISSVSERVDAVVTVISYTNNK